MAKEKLRLRLQRRNGELGLHLEVPQPLEDYFEQISGGETETSEVWFTDKEGTKGAEFYKLTPEYEEMERKINGGLDTFNSYGAGLFRNANKINLAPLRTKGAKEGIDLYSPRHFSELANIDFEFYIRTLGEATKRLFTNAIADRTLKALITIEL